jgi:hypothetical protein
MNVENLRSNAEHCLTLANAASDELQRMRWVRAAKTWQRLADMKQQADMALMSSSEEVSVSEPSVIAALPA